MSSESNSAKQRTITLTDRPPVRIREKEWPEIARASFEHKYGDHRLNASCETRIHLRVRQHADHRALIYSTYTWGSAAANERSLDIKVGRLFADAGANLAGPIRDVGTELERRVQSERPEDAPLILRLIDECIASLPVEDLT